RPRPLTATGVIDDPGIVVVPAALGLVAGLTLHRILPVLMRLVAGLLGRTRSTALYLAAKRSSRATASFRWPLLLVVVATSLAAFLASLSLSLERQLVDDTYLTVGADHAAEQFVRPGATLATAADYEALPGVAAATTTLELDGQLDGAGGEPVRVLAVDVATYGTAVHWQSWYDDETLGDLLTVLQGAPDHVIVSESLIERSGLRVGDDLTYAVGVGFTPDFRTRLLTTTGSVVATTRHFPRWAGAERAPLLVANVEYLAAQADVEATTTLLRSVEPGAVVEPPFRARDTSAGGQLAAVRDQPERQGVFGILTASFLASTALAGLALVLHSVFSYRERSVEVGILRAGGLGSGELGRLVGFDAVVTGAVGVGVGAATGIAASRWLVTDVVATIESTAPAEARIAWGPTLSVAGAFVLTLVVIAVVTTPLLTRLRVFQAIKLGEQL
ncbi:MAG: FtsX-like permease family protein, partial [Actinomycetota bacterium]